MKVHFPGLIVEKLASGKVRYRVRPKGDRAKRIRIYAKPGEPDFSRQYTLARAGKLPEPDRSAADAAKTESISWLVHKYFEHFEKRVRAGTASAKTLKKRRNLLNRLLKTPDKKMLIPKVKLVEMQDKMSATPSQADAFIEAISVMYDWAIEREYLSENPAKEVRKIYTKGSGATPWKAADVKRFFAVHPLGTKAHVAMSLLLWTGCRIEDLTILGKRHECVIDGVEALRFIPAKKRSTEVVIPLLAPLKAAVEAAEDQGGTYVVGRSGKPYASGDAMSAMFKRWCVQAGLPDRSAHGVRKCMAELLAELGCSQYEIMAILGHSEAKTSEVYTRRVERWKLAKSAMERIDVSTTYK